MADIVEARSEVLDERLRSCGGDSRIERLLRVRLARRLLDGGPAPALVAAQAGVADQAHLTRHFKRVVGVPPGASASAVG